LRPADDDATVKVPQGSIDVVQAVEHELRPRAGTVAAVEEARIDAEHR
jgi:hypothetical protein